MHSWTRDSKVRVQNRSIQPMTESHPVGVVFPIPIRSNRVCLSQGRSQREVPDTTGLCKSPLNLESAFAVPARCHGTSLALKARLLPLAAQNR